MPSLCNKKEIQMLQFFCSELSLSRVQFLLLFLMALCYKLINFKIFNARKHKKTLKEQGWLSSKILRKTQNSVKWTTQILQKQRQPKILTVHIRQKSMILTCIFPLSVFKTKTRCRLCELIKVPVAASL